MLGRPVVILDTVNPTGRHARCWSRFVTPLNMALGTPSHPRGSSRVDYVVHVLGGKTYQLKMEDVVVYAIGLVSTKSGNHAT